MQRLGELALLDDAGFDEQRAERFPRRAGLAVPDVVGLVCLRNNTHVSAPFEGCCRLPLLQA